MRYQTHGFSWSCHECGSVLQLSFNGALDRRAVRVALRALPESLAGRRRTVALDLGGVSSIDGSGLALLERTKDDLEARDGRLVVSGLSPAVKQVVEATGSCAWLNKLEAVPAKLVPCPICDGPLSPLARMCGRCISAL